MKRNSIAWWSGALAATALGLIWTAGSAQTKVPIKVGQRTGDALGKLGSRVVKLEPASRQIRVEISTFQCENADEDSIISDGDEPYLIPLVCLMDGTTIRLDNLAASTVRFMTRAKMHGNLERTGVKAGDLFGVPTKTGVFDNTIRPIAATAEFPLGMPAQVGLVVVACEQDKSSDIIAEVAASQVKTALEDEITKLVRNMRPADRDQISRIVRDSFGHRLVAVLGDTNILGAIDPDNVVGSGFRSWTLEDLERAGANGIPFFMAFSSTGVKYNVRGIARIVTQQVQKEVTVVIRSVRGIDDLEGYFSGKPDFQARIVLGGKAWMSPEQTGNPIQPNWSFFSLINGPDVPLTIELFERDGVTSDEHCDINPRKGAKSLSLRYNLATGMVSGDVNGLGTSVLTARGGGDSNRAEITFSVVGVPK